MEDNVKKRERMEAKKTLIKHSKIKRGKGKNGRQWKRRK